MAMTKEEKAAYKKAWAEKNKEKLAAQRKEWREKNKELVKKQKAEKYKKNKTEIKQKVNEYRLKNIQTIKQKKEIYRKTNKEKIKNYYEINKNKFIMQNRIWKENNKEKIKEYEEKNKDKKVANKAKRRAAQIQRTPCWLTNKCLKKIETIYAKAKKLEEKTGIKHHVDHIIPLQGKLVSGLHVPENLRVVTAKENLSKSNQYHVN